jgi:hypothetical protein
MSTSDRERWLRPLEVGLAVIALVVSIVALIATVLLSRQNNNTAGESLAVARQSLETANTANKIARGLEYPQIMIIPDDSTHRVLTLKDVESRRIVWKVWNTGPIDVYGIEVRVIPLGGLTYAVNGRDEKFPPLARPFTHVTAMLDFDRILPPDAYVWLDITGPVWEAVRRLKLPYEDPKRVYRSVFHVILSPRKGKDEPPIQARTTRGEMPDRGLLTVECIPEIIESEDVANLLKEKKPYHDIDVPHDIPYK